VPANNEVIGLWLVGLFSGDFMIGFLNLPAACLLVLGTLELGRQIGVPTPFRHLLALVVVTTEVVIHQALTAKNDTAVVALLMATLAYICRHIRSAKQTDLCLAAVALGLLGGIKYYALGYAMVAGATWVFCRYVTSGWQAAGKVMLVIVAGGLLFGGYWYLRNIVVAGTPFYPKGITFGTDTVSQWRPKGVWHTTLAGNGDPRVPALLFRAIEKHSSPITFAAVVLIPTTLIWLIGGRWLLSQATPKLERVARWGCAVSIIGSGIVWIITPFAVEAKPGTLTSLRNGYLPVRFGLCFLSLSLVAFAVVIGDCWSRIRPTILRAFLIGITIIAIGWYEYVVLSPRVSIGEISTLILPTIIVGSLEILLWRMLAWLGSCSRLATVACTVFMAACISIICFSRAKDWHENFTSYYDGQFQTSMFSNMEDRDHSLEKVFFVGVRSYPFSGSRRQTAICRELRLMTESRFRSYLLDHGVSHVLVSVTENDWVGFIPRIREWVISHPEIFLPIIADSAYALYEINRKTLDSWPAGR
jgi:hypothetical protein